MSSVGEGEIIWYRDRRTALDPEDLERLLALLGENGDGSGSWSLVSSQWKDIQDNYPEFGYIESSDVGVVAALDDVRKLPVPPGVVIVHGEASEEWFRKICVFRTIPRELMLAMIDPRVLFRLVPGRASESLKIGVALGETITKAIDPEIAQTFRPDSFTVTIGSHPLMDSCDDGNPVYAGESFFDVSLYGFGYPFGPQNYRDALARIPEVIDFQHKLSEILGPVKLFARWEPP